MHEDLLDTKRRAAATPPDVESEVAPPSAEDEMPASAGARWRALDVRRKILALVMVSALLPALLVGSVSYFSARGFLTQKVHTQLEGRLATTRKQFESAIAERVTDTEVFANAFMVNRALETAAAQLQASESGDASGVPPSGARDDLAKLQQYLDEVAERYPLYRELLVFDAGGLLVARAVDEGRGGLAGAWEPTAHERAEVDTSGLQPLVVVQRPVRSSFGRPIGALVVVSALDDLWQDLRADSTLPPGRLMLVDAEGVPLFDSAHTKGGGVGPIHSAGVKASFGALPGILEYHNEADQNVLAAFDHVPAHGLGLVVEVDASEALEAVSRLRLVVLAISLATAFLIVALGSLLAVNLTRPIDALIERARHAADGDLTTEIPVTTGDQIGELTGSFNRMIRSLKLSQERLKELSVTDELTGLYNRRYLIKAIDRELTQGTRPQRPFSLVMFDLDRFKQLNDERGHLVGDRFLREVGMLLSDALRPTDVVARYGGEEFVILLPNTGKGEAGAVAERIRMRFASREPSMPDAPRVTISAGVASYPDDGCKRTELMVNVDAALYEAKRLGRNRVEICRAA